MFVTLKTEVVRAYGRRPRGISSGFFMLGADMAFFAEH
nr:MAG TPA: hypothetical protein [Caudoviricetes sp.]DAU33795.1 MAG TPA: hypothetical protein [Bacteriophage sp.]